ncbi:PREDICTED: uncharacterized protein LOC102012844 isoform X2 [Chinchilla lanigera]|uniref:uncharacterized protein LOC102012844 isoform X2 n=1 Tax=Chinchilla lanigera TaxID=34839 RepID=UPI0006960B28|nr:PREDICTED: uncharacterized protein LOC102012844 isoform X2 [Chinchilla lanigera]
MKQGQWAPFPRGGVHPGPWVSGDHHPIWPGRRERATPPGRPRVPWVGARRSGRLPAVHPVPPGGAAESPAVARQLGGPAVLVREPGAGPRPGDWPEVVFPLQLMAVHRCGRLCPGQGVSGGHGAGQEAVQPPVLPEDVHRLPGRPPLVLHLQQLCPEPLHAGAEGVLLLLPASLHHADQHHVLGGPQGPG